MQSEGFWISKGKIASQLYIKENSMVFIGMCNIGLEGSSCSVDNNLSKPEIKSRTKYVHSKLEVKGEICLYQDKSRKIDFDLAKQNMTPY